MGRGGVDYITTWNGQGRSAIWLDDLADPAVGRNRYNEGLLHLRAKPCATKLLGNSSKRFRWSVGGEVDDKPSQSTSTPRKTECWPAVNAPQPV